MKKINDEKIILNLQRNKKQERNPGINNKKNSKKGSII